MAARFRQPRPTRNRISRRILLYRAFDDGDWRSRRLALGRDLSRPARLHEPCPSADFEPHHLPGEFDGSSISTRTCGHRCERGVLRVVSHGRVGVADDPALFREVWTRAPGWRSVGQLVLVSGSLFRAGTRNGDRAREMVPAVFQLPARGRGRLPGDAAEYELCDTKLVAATEGARS